MAEGRGMQFANDLSLDRISMPAKQRVHLSLLISLLNDLNLNLDSLYIYIAAL